MKQENGILEVDSEINKLLKIFTSRLRKLIIRDFFLLVFICLLNIVFIHGQYSNEIKSHNISSPFQKENTTIRILLPDHFTINKK